MSERTEAECVQILQGLGYTQHQIEHIGPGLSGGLNAWVDAELAEAEEQLLGKDPAAYAAEMSAPFVAGPDEVLSLELIDYQGGAPAGLVLRLARETEDEFRRILDDYGAGHLPVSVEETVEDNADGTPRRRTSVVTSGDESTLDLLHDNVLDVLGPRLREQLDANGYERIRVHVLFSSLSQWL